MGRVTNIDDQTTPAENNANTIFSLLTTSITVMSLSFWTDRSGKTLQTQIRRLLGEQSDQGLHCLQFHLQLF